MDALNTGVKTASIQGQVHFILAHTGTRFVFDSMQTHSHIFEHVLSAPAVEFCCVVISQFRTISSQLDS